MAANHCLNHYGVFTVLSEAQHRSREASGKKYSSLVSCYPLISKLRLPLSEPKGNHKAKGCSEAFQRGSGDQSRVKKATSGTVVRERGQGGNNQLRKIKVEEI